MSAFGQVAAAKTAAKPEAKAAASATGCTITPNDYLGWKAQKLANKWVTLQLVPQIGGRVMQVTFGGHDYLYINDQQKGKVLPLDGSAGRGGNYGGDKIWPLPEGNDDEQHWAQGGLQPLDFGDYKFEVLSRGATCAVRMTGPPNPLTVGQRYIREVSIGTDSPVITFKSTMQNTSGFPQTWSAQTISEYPTVNAQGVANDKLYSVVEINPKSAYPGGYHIETGPKENNAYSTKDGNLWVHWNNISQEAWIDSQSGWLAAIDGSTGYTMIERHKIDPNMEYPGKATIIFYSAGGRRARPGQTAPAGTPPPAPGSFVEEEVNSPMANLAPGESYTMETTWYPTRMDENFKTTTWSGVVGTPLTANRTASGLNLTAKYGVFYAGKLVAHFYPKPAASDGTQELMTVTPLEPSELNVVVQAPDNTARVSIHLVDEKGVDRGPLGEALVNPPPPRPQRGGGNGQ